MYVDFGEVCDDKDDSLEPKTALGKILNCVAILLIFWTTTWFWLGPILGLNVSIWFGFITGAVVLAFSIYGSNLTPNKE